MKKKDDLPRIRCKRCNSTLGYLRIVDRQWVCRNCGFIGDYKGDGKNE